MSINTAESFKSGSELGANAYAAALVPLDVARELALDDVRELVGVAPEFKIANKRPDVAPPRKIQ